MLYDYNIFISGAKGASNSTHGLGHEKQKGSLSMKTFVLKSHSKFKHDNCRPLHPLTLNFQNHFTK